MECRSNMINVGSFVNSSARLDPSPTYWIFDIQQLRCRVL